MDDSNLGDVDKSSLILGIINQFLQAYGNKIEGKFVTEIAIEC